MSGEQQINKVTKPQKGKVLPVYNVSVNEHCCQKLSVRKLSRIQDFRYKIVNHFFTHSSNYSWQLHSEHKYPQFDLALEFPRPNMSMSASQTELMSHVIQSFFIISCCMTYFIILLYCSPSTQYCWQSDTSCGRIPSFSCPHR